MRQDIDADAYRLELGRRFENATSDTGAMQHQAKCQSADAGADDQNFHSKNPTISRPGVYRPSMSYSIYRKVGRCATGARDDFRTAHPSAQTRLWRPKARRRRGPMTRARPNRQVRDQGTAKPPGRSAPS